MPGKHNAGGCGCCDAPCEHCPDYADDWTFILCGLASTVWTFQTGTDVFTWVNALGAFNLSLDSTNTSGEPPVTRYKYKKSWTFPANTYTWGVYPGEVIVFTTLDAVFEVFDDCEAGVALLVTLTANFTHDGTPNNVPWEQHSQDTYYEGCGNVISKTLTDNYLTAGIAYGTAGVVSLTC